MMTEDATDREKAAMWARKILKTGNFCILDTETTGLGPTAEICQVAILDSSGNPLLDTLVHPTVPIEPDASDIHGISNLDIVNAPSFDSLLIPLLRAVGTKDLVIYNCEYDTRLIKQSLRPYGVQLAFPTSDRRGCRIFTNGGSLHCAMLQYSAWVGEWNHRHQDYRWQKLPGGDHTAMGDCRATLAIIRQMAEG